jgi:hypothetical protein
MIRFTARNILVILLVYIRDRIVRIADPTGLGLNPVSVLLP